MLQRASNTVKDRGESVGRGGGKGSLAGGTDTSSVSAKPTGEESLCCYESSGVDGVGVRESKEAFIA